MIYSPKKHWNNLQKVKKFRPFYPDEMVIRFMESHFMKLKKKRIKTKILDIGCGAGRHLKLFAENGFNVYGIDFSNSGISSAKKLLKDHHLNANFFLGSMYDLPYSNNFFDGIISVGSFAYSDSVGMQKSIDEMYRVLKYHGKGFVNLRSVKDYRFGKGKKIEASTFKLNISNTNENNLVMHFLSKKHIKKYFSKFRSIHIDKNEFTCDNMKLLHSNWLITLIK